jgi:LPXTG-motif cell wall-anchored protein
MLTSIKKVLFIIAFVAVLVACDTQQGMMHGGGSSMNMGNWNWVLILIGIIIVFLLGYLFARRRK